ncbi:hypothetical protein P7K49_006397, partial [Saguinus oedipus]
LQPPGTRAAVALREGAAGAVAARVAPGPPPFAASLPPPRSPPPLLPSPQRAGTMSAETANGPTEDQVEILEYNFNKVHKRPDPTTLCLIAAEAGLSEEETQVRPRTRPARPTPAQAGPSRGWGGPDCPPLPLGCLPAISHRFGPHPCGPDPAWLPPAPPRFPAPMGAQSPRHPQPAAVPRELRRNPAVAGPCLSPAA